MQGNSTRINTFGTVYLRGSIVISIFALLKLSDMRDEVQ
nr:MAG TPA: hypothetical protein [Caudoviricetes sp.]